MLKKDGKVQWYNGDKMEQEAKGTLIICPTIIVKLSPEKELIIHCAHCSIN